MFSSNLFFCRCHFVCRGRCLSLLLFFPFAVFRFAHGRAIDLFQFHCKTDLLCRSCGCTMSATKPGWVSLEPETDQVAICVLCVFILVHMYSFDATCKFVILLVQPLWLRQSWISHDLILSTLQLLGDPLG